MARGPDAATLLARALVQAAQAAGVAVTIVDADWDRWASATFAGARHHLTVAHSGDAAARAWLDALPDADWTLRGHLVAEIVVCGGNIVADRHHSRIEMLTVETG